ncbi:MAG: penicillin acylase family protein [Acidobacteria bacterium]|nr:penicillin acylase family protein [Acidobacteriota bacterium]
MRVVLVLTLLWTAARAEKVEIVRDEFGVAHIFAQSAAGAAYGSGYAQASDRLEEMMRNYRKAEGTMSEVFGKEWEAHDYRQRMWRHREVAQKQYPRLKGPTRAVIEGFVAGVKKYMGEHPNEVPWAVKLEPWHVVALSRFTIQRWPEGEALGDLRRAGIPVGPMPYLGSNQMLIAPHRTAMKAPIAIIDPHLSWYGETRYYEMRVYGGEIAHSGGARVGLPFPVLGHNRYLSIAMTTGGPDTSDVFEEEVRDGKYLFKGEWRPLEVKRETIGGKAAVLEFTHHGPIVARKNGKAYAMASPYLDQFGLVEQTLAMIEARNLAGMKKALAMRQYMAQNIMVGTVDGDIFYIRNGRVPIRPKGCDPSKPQPGATGECEWQGLHPIEDLVQIHNPPSGYMQNDNVSPWAMMKDSPLVPEKWADHPYLYNDTRRPAHQRAAMNLEELDAATQVTAEQAIALAFSTQVHKAGMWQQRIHEASSGSGFAKLILDWNRRSDADSRGALAFYLFKMALGGELSRLVEPPASLADSSINAALEKAEAQIKAEFSPDAVYGTFFRVGREGAGRTYPVGGGSLIEAGMATPRAISFQKSGNLMVGQGGQTQTQIVVLTRPPQSWMVLPLGQSDHKDSPHFDDQAGKLFSQARAKPTYFLNRKELEKHSTGRKALEYP